MRLVLGWRDPAAPFTRFHPVLAARGRLARLPERPAALKTDLGTVNKLPCCLCHLHKKYFFMRT